MAAPPDDRSSPGSAFRGQDRTAAGETIRVPVVEEQIEVGKREVERRVRVRTVVDEERVNLSELLEHDAVEVERVPVGAEVQTAPQPFEENGILVVPVIEERLIVEKRLFVVEELRIRRRHFQERVEVPVTRRVMRAEVDRQPVETARAAMPFNRPEPTAAANDEPHVLPPHHRGAPASGAAAPAAALRDRQPARTEPVGQRRRTNWTAWILGTLALLALLLGIARYLTAQNEPDTVRSAGLPAGIEAVGVPARWLS